MVVQRTKLKVGNWGGKDRLLPYLLYWLLDSCTLYSGCRRYSEQDTQYLPFRVVILLTHTEYIPIQLGLCAAAASDSAHQRLLVELMCWSFFVTLACKSHTEDMHFALPNGALAFLNTSHCCLGPSGAEGPLGQKALFSSMYSRHEVHSAAIGEPLILDVFER